MATLLDIGILKNFSVIFPFLFVFVVVYGVLEMIQIFGKEKRHIHSMIAFLLAIMTMFSPVVTKTVALMAPWFVLITIVSVLGIMVYMMFGLEREKMVAQWASPKGIKDSPMFYWLLAIVLIIAIGSFMTVLGEQKGFGKLTGSNQTTDELISEPSDVAGTGTSAFFATLTHPKVLGAALVLLIATFAMLLLTDID